MFPKWSLQFVAGFSYYSYRLQNEEGIGESLPIPFRIFLHVRAIMYIAQTLLSADKTFKSVSWNVRNGYWLIFIILL